MKVREYIHKNQKVLICMNPKCAAVVANPVSTKNFPNGYKYEKCPKCAAELDYDNVIALNTQPEQLIGPNDKAILAIWIAEADEQKRLRDEAKEKEKEKLQH
jgi:hypothetical protein